MSKGAQIAVGALAIAALLGWYGWNNLEPGSSFQYYQTIEEFRADTAGRQGGSFRVHGYVADGSIERDVPAKQVRFRVQNDPPHAVGNVSEEAQPTLSVVYQGLVVPDLFKGGAEVVVEGTLASHDGRDVFVADNLLAKCPSKFAPEEAGAAEAAL